MNVARTVADVRAALLPARGGSIGLVPTMGAFHEGHVSLFRAARAECDTVVISLFVNPVQFGAGDDFVRYPRDEARDRRVAEEAGADLLFAPAAEELYPPGYQTWVEVEEVSRGLEGAARPGHFRGVATVCLKLFNIVRPDRAYFGAKDAQQVAIVTRMVDDLNLDLAIRVVPTARDRDGLALSSRNSHLSDDERAAALALPRALAAGARAHSTGEDPVGAARAVLAEEPRLQLDYVEVARFNGRPLLLAAAHVGGTRLIDNVPLEGEPA